MFVVDLGLKGRKPRTARPLISESSVPLQVTQTGLRIRIHEARGIQNVPHRFRTALVVPEQTAAEQATKTLFPGKSEKQPRAAACPPAKARR